MMDISDSLKSITVASIMIPNVITVKEKQSLRGKEQNLCIKIT
jgi:hypothetical protein